MTIKARIDDRLFSLEAEIRRLQAMVAQLEQRQARARQTRQVYLAICKELSGSYPATGSTIPIVFVDASFAEVVPNIGTLDVTEIHSEAHRIAWNLKPDNIPARLSVIPVWSQQGRWFTDYTSDA